MAIASPIPPKLKKEMEEDPFYSVCCITGVKNEKIDWHHNLQFAGKRVNEKFCILPLAKSVHDNITYYKEECDWIMWNRASEEELTRYSKAIDYRKVLARLNEKFGLYKVIHKK